MFGKNNTSSKRKKNGPPGILRFFISLLIIAVLGIGLYQAFKTFSGYDPLSVNLKNLPENILSSQSLYNIMSSVLSFNPEKLHSSISHKTQISVSALPSPKNNLKFKFAIIADSHIDTDSLLKALQQAKQANVAFVIGMGDLSNVGTIEELENTKKQYDAIGLPYYITPGDHDLWDSRNKNEDPTFNFVKVFGSPYQSIAYQNVRIMIIDNSDDYLGLSDLEMNWVQSELDRIKKQHPQIFFVVADTPFYHPSSDHVMNRLNPKLEQQADELLSLFNQYKVNEVFSADTHFFSRYTEPSTGLKMTTVGAVTSDRNPQSPRFAIIDVYDNGSYNVEETEVK